MKVENGSLNGGAGSVFATAYQSIQAHGVNDQLVYAAAYAEHLARQNRDFTAHKAGVCAPSTNEKIIAQHTTARESGNVAIVQRADNGLQRRFDARRAACHRENGCKIEIRDYHNYPNRTTESPSGDE